MNLENSQNTKGIKQFSTWRALIIALLDRAGKDPKVGLSLSMSQLKKRLKMLDECSKNISQHHPTKLIEILSRTDNAEHTPIVLDDIYNKFKQSCIGENQFYSVFDLAVGWHIDVDDKIETALGMEPEKFSLLAMAGLDTENPLYHADDVYHMIRWVAIAHLILNYPGLVWRTYMDHYYVSHRVASSHLKGDPQFYDFVTLEKKCFPVFTIDKKGNPKALVHFIQWSVMDAADFDYVKPRWITSSNQSKYLNGLFYLFNVYLMGLSPKYIAILHERMTYDRNKAIATSMNRRVMKWSKFDPIFDEVQIGNMLTKTIRPKLAAAFNTWDKRDKSNSISIQSDAEAVHYAKVLGLLPIPEFVLQLIYMTVSSKDSKENAPKK